MFLDDLAARLVTQGVGVISGPNINIFWSSRAVLPAGDGPYLTMAETGGIAPTRVQSKVGAATKRPSAQIIARAATEAAARAMIDAAYAALDGVFNTTINGTYYIKIVARQEPTDMGFDATGKRIQFVFNVETERNP